MSAFRIEKKKNTVIISGIINEFSEFGNVFNDIKKAIRVDMSGVERINSCGIRAWVQAIRDIPQDIIYFNCPPVVIESFNMVPEFLGSKSKVESFFARYYCDKCDIEKMFFLIVKDYLKKYPDLNAPEYNCKCGMLFEFDDNEDEFFMFLNKDFLNRK